MSILAALVGGVLAAQATPAAATTEPPEAAWITAHTDRNPTVSPDGRTILFQSDRSGRPALYARPADGGPVSLFLDSGDSPTYPDWSPDGRRVVFAAEVGGQADIFVIGADGRDRRRLTDHPAREGHPRWSPDGARIVFNSERAAAEPGAPQGEDVVDIYSVAADGSDLRRHTRCRAECSYPSISPDGSRLLYRRVFWRTGADGERTRDSEVVTAGMDGADEVNLTADPAYDVYPIWSHDGRHVYFSSVRPGSEGRMHLWRAPAGGGPAERLTGGAWSHRQAAPDRQGGKVYMFTFQRHGRTDLGYIGAIAAPKG